MGGGGGDYLAIGWTAAIDCWCTYLVNVTHTRRWRSKRKCSHTGTICTRFYYFYYFFYYCYYPTIFYFFLL